mmetsp:Transcript_25181/g.83148  ORF Transcript_25181/g.83148 Transcript_25181/m.83148 type:complete len:192 (+) Transcript_25181:157-732(+)
MDSDRYLDFPLYHPSRIPIPSHDQDIEDQFSIEIDPSSPDDRLDWLHGASTASDRLQSQNLVCPMLHEAGQLLSRASNDDANMKSKSSNDVGNAGNILASQAPGQNAAHECKAVKVQSRQFANEASRQIEITPDLLSQHFHESLESAAASIGIGKSTMKVVCRRLGIEKWPYVRKGSRRKPGQRASSEDSV